MVGDGWLCALCAPGSGVWVGDRGCVFGAGAETVIAYPLCRGVRLSKIRGDRLLTGVGGDGGARDWMVLYALRHHITGGWGRRLRGLYGLFGLLFLGPGLALLL